MFTNATDLIPFPIALFMVAAHDDGQASTGGDTKRSVHIGGTKAQSLALGQKAA